MIKDITLGQYFPGKSLIHKADPRIKIILTVLYIVFVFIAKSLFAYIFALLFTCLVLVISKLPVKVVIKGLKPVLYIMFFTAVINLFWTNGDEIILNFWIFHIYKEGIIYAVYMILRILCLITGTSILLTYTTSPIDLTDGIEQLLSPLKKVKVPVHEFAMMMSIALRFIPTLIEETDKIINAQKARGADFSSGSIVKRTKSLFPVLIPLFVSSIRRADELATAMECRCYHGGEGRTRMKSLKYGYYDFILLFIMITAGVCIVIINNLFPVWVL